MPLMSQRKTSGRACCGCKRKEIRWMKEEEQKFDFPFPRCQLDRQTLQGPAEIHPKEKSAFCISYSQNPGTASSQALYSRRARGRPIPKRTSRVPFPQCHLSFADLAPQRELTSQLENDFWLDGAIAIPFSTDLPDHWICLMNQE